MIRRNIYWSATIFLLILLAVIQISSAKRESATADEPLEIAAGYTYLKTGDFRLNPEHPPLAKLIAALPLLRFGLLSPPDLTAWRQADAYGFGQQFFEANARKADGMLFAARATSIVLTLCFALTISVWTRRNYGSAAALIALTLFTFDPTIDAHGHYAKNDVAVALFAFLSCISWTAFLTTPNVRRLAIAGLALGVALATKFSALFLLPALAVLYFAHYLRAPQRLPVWRGLGSLATVFAVASMVVFSIYFIPARTHGVSLGGGGSETIHALPDRTAAGAGARSQAGVFTAHPYLVGLTRFLDHGTTGHRSYLLGEFRTTGWLYYFPVAFAVKEPVTTLVFLALGAALLAFRLRRRPAIPFHALVLAIPAITFCAFSFSSRIDIGIRHLLPIWPFLFIAAAAIFVKARLRYAPAILTVFAATLAAESLSAWPHYLSFFNVAAGGPANGPKLLLDSNIDWGQDALTLQTWLGKHPASRLCLNYWGNANMARLGITGPPLLRDNRVVSLDCVAAVSVNFLYGLSPEMGDFGWLRSLPPDARVGNSIYIYDLPKLTREKRLPLDLAPVAPAFQSIAHQGFRGTPTASDPIRPGEFITLYMTGLGPVNPRVPAGQPAPASPLSRVILPFTCQWNAAAGGPPADVLYAGLAPGLIGTYQVNLRVATGMTAAILTCGVRKQGDVDSKSASVSIPLRN